MLAIDIGNSRIKWVLFHLNEIISHGAFEYRKDRFEIALDSAKLPVGSNELAISHVAGEEIKSRFINWLKINKGNKFSFAETRSEQCNIRNSYKTPDNMGVDRWLAMIAAFNAEDRGKTDAVCVVDCGTAITLDLLGLDGQHQGGLIMPGYQTMLHSLIKNTGNIQILQQTKSNIASEGKLGRSTQEAVEQGCIRLIVNGLSGIISRQQKNMGEKMYCVVTGGDGQWVSENLEIKNSYQPFLVLQGLRLVNG